MAETNEDLLYRRNDALDRSLSEKSHLILILRERVGGLEAKSAKQGKEIEELKDTLKRTQIAWQIDDIDIMEVAMYASGDFREQTLKGGAG